MVPALAQGGKQATLSLVGNQFGNDTYLSTHVGNEGTNQELWSSHHWDGQCQGWSHDDFLFCSSFLDGKMLVLNTMGMRGGLVLVDHCNGSFIVNVQWRWACF